MASRRKLLPPPDDYDPTAPLTGEEIKRLRPARELFAELGMPRPIGRPKAEETKISVTIRLDAEIVDFYKSTGPGWQTRVNDDLLKRVHRKRA